MYERNAIVLERYFEKKFGFDKSNNLKMNYINFSDLLEELEKYQMTVIDEEKVIQKFDEIAKKIQTIQKTQEKLSATNEKLEEERNKLFNLLDENPSIIGSKLEKIENTLEKNNEELKKLRIDFIEALYIFGEQQEQRNKCTKERRIAETSHVTFLQKVIKMFQELNPEDIKNAKDFLISDKESVEYEIYQILMKNGKNEKIGFYVDAMQIVAKTRIEIAEKEIECYIVIYDKLKKLLQEIESDNLKLAKYQKTLRDTDVKLSFLRAEKEYIVGFLDNERMIAINGVKAHQKMMEEACRNFETDMVQISNLYELILREIAGKSTKKAYRELYNKTYLKEIEDKERNFEQEVHHIKIPMGTVINSNYWRIEGIKNIYNVFQEEVSEKFAKDLSEFRIEEPEEIEDFVTIGTTKKENIELFATNENTNIRKSENLKNEGKYKLNEEDDDEEWDEEFEEEYDDEEKFDDINEEFDEEELEDEYDDEYDEEDDEYDDEYDEEDDEYDDEYDEEDDEYDDEYDEEDDEYDEYDDEYDDEDDEWDDDKQEKNINTIRNNKKKIENKEKEENEKLGESKGLFNKFFKNKKKNNT